MANNFNVSQPIVFEDGTMQYSFRDFMQRVDVAIKDASVVSVWGSVSGALSAQTDLQAALDAKADTTHTHNASDISGLPFIPMPSFDIASASYTISATDVNRVNRFTTDATSVVLPAGVSVAVDSLLVIRQSAAIALTLDSSAVTVNGTLFPWGQHVEQTLRYVGADTWEVVS